MLLLEVLLILEKEYEQNSLQLFSVVKCCKVFLDYFFLQKVLSLGFAILM